MAVDFWDGFEMYPTGDAVLSATALWNVNTTWNQIGPGTYDGQGLYMGGANDNSLYKNFKTPSTQFAACVHYKRAAPGGYTANFLLPIMGDSSLNHLHVAVRIGATGKVQLVRRNNISRGGDPDPSVSYTEATLLAESADGLVPMNVWTHISVHGVIHATAGEISLYLNGAETPVLTFTGNTMNPEATHLNAYCAGITSFGPANGTYQQTLIDNYAQQSTNLRFPELKVTRLAPISDEQKQWTPSTGTDNFPCIDDGPITAADYVSATNVGDQDYYNVADITVVPSAIYGVDVIAAAKKTDAAVRKIGIGVKSGSVEALGPDFTLSSDFSLARVQFDVDPKTGSVWTYDSLNSVLLTQKVTV